MIKHIVKYLLALAGLEFKKGTSTIFNKLSVFGILSDEWEPRQGLFYLKSLDILVADVTSPLIIQYRIAKSICRIGGGRFFYDQDHHLRLSIQEVNFRIN